MSSSVSRRKKKTQNLCGSAGYRRRILIDEQNREYDESLMKDVENEIIKNEYLEMKRENELKKKEIIEFGINLVNINKNNIIKIKFKFPDNTSIVHNFMSDDCVRKLFEFLDVMLFGDVVNYEIVFYPSMTLIREMKDDLILDLGIKTLSSCFVKDLDK